MLPASRPIWRCCHRPKNSVRPLSDVRIGGGRLSAAYRVNAKGCVGVGEKKRYSKIAASEFRHPLDQQNTAILQLLPGKLRWGESDHSAVIRTQLCSGIHCRDRERNEAIAVTAGRAAIFIGKHRVFCKGDFFLEVGGGRRVKRRKKKSSALF